MKGTGTEMTGSVSDIQVQRVEMMGKCVFRDRHAEEERSQ